MLGFIFVGGFRKNESMKDVAAAEYEDVFSSA
jgi:hypothetical protein